MIRQTSFPALCLFILLLSFPGIHKSLSMALDVPFFSTPESPEGIQLFYDEHGLYVQADLADPNYFTFQNATMPAKMMIDLSHSETLLPLNCLSFNKFSCFKYSSCQNNGTVVKDVSFPYFPAKVVETQALVSLHSKFWRLHKPAYLATSCDLNATITDKFLYGMDRSGIIGLGNLDHAERNFLTSKVFSIYLEKDIVRGGKIYFKAHDNLANRDITVKLKANSNWQVADQNGLVQIGTNWCRQSSYKLFFDLNADAIGLSAELYDSIVYQLGHYDFSYQYRPIVSSTTYAKVEDWPNLILYLQNQRVEIPATVYVTKVSEKQFMLNLRRLAAASTKVENFVTYRFDNSIVLNYQFLKYCYTVFDASAGYNQIILHFDTNGKNRDVNADNTTPTKPGTYKKEMVTAYSFFATLIYIIFRKCCCGAKRGYDQI